MCVRSRRARAAKLNRPHQLNMLPVDIYHRIAEQSPDAYRAMLALPPFARDLDMGKRLDYMIGFGHSVKISPSVIIWTKNDMWHRTDGPAFEYVGKCRQWWVNNRPHRLDLPAVEHDNGTREWWVNGERHRADGPAIEYSDGTGSWYVNGKYRG